MRIIVCLLVLAGMPVWAGQIEPPNSTGLTTRTIQGQVLTQNGQPVPEAVVLIKDSKTLQVRSYIAQKDGAYHFYGLSSDVNYTLRAENQGMTSKNKMVSVFDSHKVVTLNLKLVKKILPPKPAK